MTRVRSKVFLALVAVLATAAAQFSIVSATASADGPTTFAETVGSDAHTWTNYTNAGGSPGPVIPRYGTVQISCWLYGFRVANGNTYWYQVASSPWNYAYYVSADAFYNNGATSGSLKGTPWVDPAVPQCGSSGGRAETTGSTANTWSNYTNAGGTQGPTIGSNATITIACKLTGFRVANGNTWWYRIASAPWNNGFYVSADAFYNNGQTSGTLRGTPYVDQNVPDCNSGSNGAGGGGGSNTNEVVGSNANTWTNYLNAGGSQGPTIPRGTNVAIACKVTGFRVADGNTWWYQIASSPWNNSYFVSADAFYNNGATSGSLLGTPFVDPAVPTCSAPSQPRPAGQTAGPGGANTWTNYNNAGGSAGPRVASNQTIQVTCRITGFRVANGNTWWYQVSSSPWNDTFYVSADAFYNNGATSGSLAGTPYVDPAVPVCSGNHEVSGAGHGRGTASAASNRNGCRAADPVNCATGNFYEQFTDVAAGGRGADLALQRTYNSQGASSSGLFGAGWSSTLDQRLSLSDRDGSATITLADGSQVTAQPDGGGGFRLPAFANSTLTVGSDGIYTFTQQATTVLRFSPNGSLLSIRDLNGDGVELQYDGSRLVRVVDGAGRTIGVETEGGRVVRIIDPMGGQISYAYDGGGDLTAVTDQLDRTWRFTYDTTSQMLTKTSPGGYAVVNVYDANGRVISQTDGTGQVTTFDYTGDNYSQGGGLTTITDPHGVITVQSYINGFMTQVVKGRGTSSEATWLYEYDLSTYGMTRTTDPNGNVTVQTLNDAGLPTSVTDALGHTTQTTYNAFGQPTSVRSPSGATTTKTYDTRGNLLTSTDPRGGTTTYTYGDAAHPGDVTTVSSPAGRSTSLERDAAGNVVATTVHPEPGADQTTRTRFDAAGREVCEASAAAGARGVSCSAEGHAAGTRTATYDGAGQEVSTTDSGGHVTTHGYDLDGHEVRVEDPTGTVTTSAYDGAGRVVARTSAAGTDDEQTTITRYDVPAGAGVCPVTMRVAYCEIATGPGDRATVTGFDPLGHRVAEVLPGGRTTSWTYDSVGNKVGKKDAAGHDTVYAYDAANRVVSISYPASTTPTVTYTYDADGRRTTMSDGTGQTQTVYDAAGNVVSVTDGSGAHVGYEFDADGNVTRLTYPNGQDVTRLFDGAGRLASVTDWLGNRTGFQYDANGNAIRTALPRQGAVRSTYDWDDQLASVNVLTGSGRSLRSLTYTRDDAHRITRDASGTTSAVTTVQYAYDSLSRLSAANERAYDYDSAGNPTTLDGQQQSFDTGDRITSGLSSTGRTTYDFDAVGNRAASHLPSGAGLGYEYDRADRLTAVTRVVPGRPVLASATPTSGSIDGGNQVVLTGDALSGATRLVFGDSPATFTVDSDEQITATAPPHTAGTVRIKVSTPFGASPTIAYTYRGPAPVLTTVDPAEGPTAGGASVTLTGTHLSGATRVTFGGTPATSVTVDSDTQLSAVVPAHGAGRASVRVVTPYGTSASTPAASYLYRAPLPVVTAIAPASGPRAGGTSVVISGSGLSGASAVLFGTAAAATFTVDSDGQITATSPAGSGQRYVVVRTPGGKTAAGAAALFSYTTGVSTSAPALPERRPRSARPALTPAAFTAPTPAAATSTPVVTTVESYSYNGDGLRATKTTADGTVRFVYDNTVEVPALLSDGSAFYLYGPDGRPFEQIIAGTPSYLVQDAVGSTRAVLNADGAVAGTYSYSPYGAVTKSSGTIRTKLQYAGTYADATGLDYAINRYYDPTTAQFLTVDPVIKSTSEAYTYASRDPVNKLDPNGLWSVVICNQLCIGYDSGRRQIISGAGSTSLTVNGSAGSISLSRPGGRGQWQVLSNGNHSFGLTGRGVGFSYEQDGLHLCLGAFISYCSPSLRGGGRYQQPANSQFLQDLVSGRLNPLYTGGSNGGSPGGGTGGGTGGGSTTPSSSGAGSPPRAVC